MNSGLKYSKEPMVPCRVISNISIQQIFNKVQFPAPQLVVVKICQNPLPIRPRMIVLRVHLERFSDEIQFPSRFADLEH